MSTSPKVSLIGSGRVARQIAHALLDNGIEIQEIYSRTIAHAESLSKEIDGSTSTNQLNFSNSASEVFIISVKDDAIASVIEKLKLPKNVTLLHTSGTVSMHGLASACPNYGIIYPLQTFARGKLLDFSDIPILTEWSNDQTKAIINHLAQTISRKVYHTNESDRKKLHIAAVFASNFTNRMLASAHEILDKTSLDFEILKPLVQQSVQNAFQSHPDQALTGPAMRGDHETIDSHVNFLEDNSELQKLYMQLTNIITSRFSEPES